jgi:hypothetical protein
MISPAPASTALSSIIGVYFAGASALATSHCRGVADGQNPSRPHPREARDTALDGTERRLCYTTASQKIDNAFQLPAMLDMQKLRLKVQLGCSLAGILAGTLAECSLYSTATHVP